MNAELEKYHEEPFPPCDPEELRALSRGVLRDLNCELPRQYVAFLERMNGLDCNGLQIFGSKTTQISPLSSGMLQGIIEVNLVLRELPKAQRFLALGDMDDDLLIYSFASQRFEVIDRVSEEVWESFDTFDELLTFVLTKAFDY